MMTSSNSSDLSKNVEGQNTVIVSFYQEITTLPITAQLKLLANVTSLPFGAAIMSLSVPILAILISNSSNSSSLVYKVLIPTLSWLPVIIPLNWLLWNSIIHRTNGAEDRPKRPLSDQQTNDPFHVVLALFANVHTVTNGILATYGAINQFRLSPAPLWMTSLLGGLINGITSMLTEVDFSFRKHVEYCEQKGRPIKTLFDQPLVKPFYDKAAYFGIFLRETYPATNAIIRSMIVAQFLQEHLSSADYSPKLIGVINLITIPFIYLASAYVLHNFDIAQLRDSLDQAGRGFPLATYWSRSSYRIIRGIGDFINGQALINCLMKLKITPEISVNIILSISAIAYSGLAERGLCTYVSCNDPVGISAGQKALLMRYFLGTNKAIKIAPTLMPVMYLAACAVGSVGTFFKAPMVQKQARESMDQPLPIYLAQVQPEATSKITDVNQNFLTSTQLALR